MTKAQELWEQKTGLTSDAVADAMQTAFGQRHDLASGEAAIGHPAWDEFCGAYMEGFALCESAWKVTEREEVLVGAGHSDRDGKTTRPRRETMTAGTRRAGKPRTEAERKVRHEKLHPGTKLPPRGAGLRKSK